MWYQDVREIDWKPLDVLSLIFSEKWTQKCSYQNSHMNWYSYKEEFIFYLRIISLPSIVEVIRLLVKNPLDLI